MTTKHETTKIDAVAQELKRQYGRRYYAHNRQRIKELQAAYWRRKATVELNWENYPILRNGAQYPTNDAIQYATVHENATYDKAAALKGKS